MKNLFLIGLSAFAFTAFTACNADTDPKIDTSKEYEFKLNTPQFASQFIDLSTGGTINFTVSQPEYGVTIVPIYNLEISLTPEFPEVTEETVIDSSGEEHVVPGTYQLNLDGTAKGILIAKMTDIAAGINQMLGLFDQDMYDVAYPDGGGYVGPLYVRASSAVGDGKHANVAISNTVTLAQVEGFPKFPSKEVKLCVPGGGNNWAEGMWQLVYTKDTEDGSAMIFQGFSYINGGFKINDGDWAGQANWGADEGDDLVEGLKKVEADGTYTGNLIQNSQGNFNDKGKALAPGLYYIQLEVTAYNSTTDNENVGTITLTPIEKICVIGDFCGWGFDTAVDMVDAGDGTTWTASGAFTGAGWKFAFNGGWGINLGINNDYEGEAEVTDPLIFDGANIEKDASSVTLNLKEYPWTFTAN